MLNEFLEIEERDTNQYLDWDYHKLHRTYVLHKLSHCGDHNLNCFVRQNMEFALNELRAN